MAARPLALVVSVDLALLSAGAGIIHLAVLGPHLREFWLFGVFFAAAALAQLGWALLVMMRPSRRVWLAGALGNALVIVVWILSRTVGLPFGLMPAIFGHIPLPAKITVQVLPKIDLRERYGDDPDVDEINRDVLAAMQDVLTALQRERRLPLIG